MGLFLVSFWIVLEVFEGSTFGDLKALETVPASPSFSCLSLNKSRARRRGGKTRELLGESASLSRPFLDKTQKVAAGFLFRKKRLREDFQGRSSRVLPLFAVRGKRWENDD